MSNSYKDIVSSITNITKVLDNVKNNLPIYTLATDDKGTNVNVVKLNNAAIVLGAVLFDTQEAAETAAMYINNLGSIAICELFGIPKPAPILKTWREVVDEYLQKEYAPGASITADSIVAHINQSSSKIKLESVHIEDIIDYVVNTFPTSGKYKISYFAGTKYKVGLSCI